MRVLAFVDDLMDRSRISGAIDDVEFVRAIPADIGTGPVLAIVDGGRPRNQALVDDLVGRGVGVLVFLPHVETDGAQRYRAGGATVLSRNRFFNDVAAVITRVHVADTGE